MCAGCSLHSMRQTMLIRLANVGECLLVSYRPLAIRLCTGLTYRAISLSCGARGEYEKTQGNPKKVYASFRRAPPRRAR